MIKVSVLYPNQPGGTFDMDYYIKHHVPLVLDRCGADVSPGGIERGVSGAPGTDAPYAAAGHLLFESPAAMERSFLKLIPEFIADVPNFTNITPVLQVSEVVVEHGRRA